jgi:hypothetical protein
MKYWVAWSFPGDGIVRSIFVRSERDHLLGDVWGLLDDWEADPTSIPAVWVDEQTDEVE